jgi:hypothetical protein
MSRFRTPLAALAAALLLSSVGACQDTSGPKPPLSLKVLFIGNSLTYYNNLPGTVAEIAVAGGDVIQVEMVAKPGYALIDHLTDGTEAEDAIRREPWDYVVLQQGPTTLPVNRDSLILWTKMFEPIIRSMGARPALYMVWPNASQPGNFGAVRTSFQMAADAVAGVFLPAGVAWQDAWQRDAALPLSGPDGFHPSPLGTYLAALTIYERLTGHDPRSLPPYAIVDGAALNVPEATIRLLQQAAHSANTRF